MTEAILSSGPTSGISDDVENETARKISEYYFEDGKPSKERVNELIKVPTYLILNLP